MSYEITVLCSVQSQEQGKRKNVFVKFGPKVKRKSCLFLRCPKVTLFPKKLKTNEM